MPMVVRNDIEQQYKNAYLWHTLWKKKEPTELDKGCEGYSNARINAISKAVGVADKKIYNSLQDWLKDLEGKPVSVTVKHELYNDKPQAKADFINPTKKPDCKHAFKATPAVEGNFYTVANDIDDEDIPF